ncbi:MAG TPA: AmmeMemoRadiSam system protein A [Burkholderiales bacterium]|nr:AmmeMemoRadiSam system protein A [Burkholderiales bacterium]
MTRGEVLLFIARAAISRELGRNASAPEDVPWLKEKQACFVTLMLNRQLRGCIGTLEAYRPLLEDVKENAIYAAFREPRFPPLTLDELDETRIEISLLSAATPIYFAGEDDALKHLCPGVDGVILQYANHRATFLPQVWDKLAEPATFMNELKLKAGLKDNFWDEGIRLYRYTVEKWREWDLQEALS